MFSIFLGKHQKCEQLFLTLTTVYNNQKNSFTLNIPNIFLYEAPQSFVMRINTYLKSH